MSPVLRIFLLWRRQAGWLLFGTLLFLASLAAGLALMGASGRYIALSLLGGAVLVPAVLQYIGAARVVLRYLERVFTHEAMFRALAGLRIWLFTGLARSAAGGLGYRRAGDALARLVNDVDALDGLLLRIFLPLLGAVLMTPVLALLLWHEQHWALAVLAPFAFVAFYLPMLAARAAAANGARAGLAMSGLRSAALDALSGLREVKIYAAEGRMLAAVQAREAAYLAAQRELVGQTSALNAVAFVVAQAGLLLAMLIGISGAPVITIITVFVLITAFETVLGLPRAGLLYGHARAAAARVVDQIAVPTLILQAQDDPFIRLLPETRAKLLANPCVTFVETRHGGHCGYLSRDPGDEIHWAEATVMRFLMAATGEAYGS